MNHDFSEIEHSQVGFDAWEATLLWTPRAPSIAPPAVPICDELELESQDVTLIGMKSKHEGLGGLGSRER